MKKWWLIYDYVSYQFPEGANGLRSWILGLNLAPLTRRTMNGDTKQEQQSPTRHCVFAGMLSALAGASCKAAASTPDLAANFSLQHPAIHRVLSLLFYCGYILLSWRSWNSYVAGMEGIPSLQAAVITSSTNSLSMGCLAWLFFNEQLSSKWCLGVGFMLVGVYFLSKAPIEKRKVA